MKTKQARRPGHLALKDLFGLGIFGLRARPGRVFLSALGIAIGIAAMIAVVGISSSSQAALARVFDHLGTNLVQISAADRGDRTVEISEDALKMLNRRADIEQVAAISHLSPKIYRNDKVPAVQSSGLHLEAVRGDLKSALQGEISSGRWFTTAGEKEPQVVLGSDAASALGIEHVSGDTRIWINGRWVAVIGIMRPLPLTPELDSSVLIPAESASKISGEPEHLAVVYARADPKSVAAARERIPQTVSPALPAGIEVSKPSDALAAKTATEDSFTGLLLGVGAVALLVGGIGVANTMVITVLERRAEVGVRRALGARRRHIRDQFLVESLLLSLLGGIGGVVIGAGVSVAFALSQQWPVVIPLWAVAGGLAATLIIGGISGLYPAGRAAKIPPTLALSAI